MDAADEGTKRPPGRPADASLGPVILAAVLNVLAEDGYARLTTATVARRAGVSTATLYRRWPSKRELMLAAATHIAAAETADVDTGSTEGDLRDLFSHKRRVLSGRIGGTLVSLIGEAAHDPELAAILRTGIVEPTREHLAAILERAAARGEPGSHDADAAARLVVGTVLADLAFRAQDDPRTPAGESAGLLPEAEATLLLRALTSRS